MSSNILSQISKFSHNLENEDILNIEEYEEEEEQKLGEGSSYSMEDTFDSLEFTIDFMTATSMICDKTDYKKSRSMAIAEFLERMNITIPCDYCRNSPKCNNYYAEECGERDFCHFKPVDSFKTTPTVEEEKEDFDGYEWEA